MLDEILYRARILVRPEIRKLRNRERWLRDWRRAKLTNLETGTFLVFREPDTVKGEEGRNIWGEPIGTLPEVVIGPTE